jgi:hypothetical protein
MAGSVAAEDHVVVLDGYHLRHCRGVSQICEAEEKVETIENKKAAIRVAAFSLVND